MIDFEVIITRIRFGNGKVSGKHQGQRCPTSIMLTYDLPDSQLIG